MKLLVLLVLACCVRANLAREIHTKWSADLIGDTILQSLSFLVGQKYVPADKNPAYFKEYALNDTSNDEIINSTVQEIILRSGYNYENYHVIADDGYITLLVRLINPLADRAMVASRPPVVLVHGGIVDKRVWVWTSSIQHHPERWPRSEKDGPITSWNRSVAFTLANNGYDVWLLGVRGSNEQNQGHVKIKSHDLFSWPNNNKASSLSVNKTKKANQLVDNQNRNLAERIKYWDYSMDEISQHELPRQIDKVLNVTGAKKINLVLMSFSSTIGMMMLAEQPQYQQKLHSTVVMTPIINNRGTNLVVALLQNVFKLIPSKLGSLIVTEVFLSQATRELLKTISSSRPLRYIITKAVQLVVAGPSAKYQTLLEPAVYANIFRPTSFKEIKHYSQIVTAARIQKYDYGPLKNKQIYGTVSPGKYDVGNIDLDPWLVIYCGSDTLAPANSAEQFVRLSKTSPVDLIEIKHYDHLDHLAAFDMDTTITLPILNFFNRFNSGARSNVSNEISHDKIASTARTNNNNIIINSTNDNSLTVPSARTLLASHAKRNSIPIDERELSRQRLMA